MPDPRGLPVLHLIMLACGVLLLLMGVSFSSTESLVVCPICLWVRILTSTKAPGATSPSPLARMWLRLRLSCYSTKELTSRWLLACCGWCDSLLPTTIFT